MRGSATRKISPFMLSSLMLCTAQSMMLTACGGGSGGLARPSGLPAAPPPPPVTIETRCLSATDTCILNGYEGLTGNRTSTGALIKDGAGFSELYGGTFSFSGGTRVASDSLFIYPNATLVSDTSVEPAGVLFLYGPLHGDLANRGKVYANQYCDDEITGRCTPGASGRIEGNYTQSADATLRLTLGMPLQITGRAGLDGTLELVAQRIDHWSAYVRPGAGTRQSLLHASGGISGTFDQWRTTGSWGDQPGIFLEGNLGYDANNVYFDVVRSSLQATMAAAGSRASTIASAGNLDRAFTQADTFATLPVSALDERQRRFLLSAASVQHIDNLAQARESLDSLSGQQHVQALRDLVANANANAQLVASRLDASSIAGAKQSGGIWLTPSLLMSGHLDAGRSSPLTRHAVLDASTSLRWFGNEGWYFGGSTGWSRYDLGLGRTLDLGEAGRWGTYSQRMVDLTSLRVEGGRTLAVGGGSLTPFLSTDATWSRAPATVEQGQTGFELALAPSLQNHLNASVGVRYTREWHHGDNSLQLQASGGYQQMVAQSGGPMHGALVGVPEVSFDLTADPGQGATWYVLGLTSAREGGWSWSLIHSQQTGTLGSARGWWLGLQRNY